MGCNTSKIEGEEALSRCRERRRLMKDSVSSRNAFAAAHSAYTISLKNAGGSLSDFAQGEVLLYPSSSSYTPSVPTTSSASPSVPTPSVAAATTVAPSDAALPPPPPPLHDFAPPLQRAASMPQIPLPKKHKHHPAVSAIEEGDADDEKDVDDETDKRSSPYIPPPRSAPAAAHSGASVWLGEYIFDTHNIPSPSLGHPDEPLQPPPRNVTPEPVEKAVIEERPPASLQPLPAGQHAKPAIKKQKAAAAAVTPAAGEGKKGRVVAPAAMGPKVDLLQVLNELDDHFLKASESAHEVWKMLEAPRLHYHSNFADNRGHIDHSARVMRVITWNRSVKGLLEEEDEKEEDFDNDEESHATILDKMLAWEKKLYDEVKTGELMKIEYNRKVALLSKQRKRGAGPDTLEKSKAAVSHMHTRLVVDMQSMDSTVSEINRLLNKQLYPMLVDLLQGMENMWRTMYMHHSSQRKIAADLRNLDVSVAPKETSEQHHDRTVQLWKVLRDWHSHFQKLVRHQKGYVRALSGWLKLSLVPVEAGGSLKENVPSPPPSGATSGSGIEPLLHAWHDLLEKLPDELASAAIYGFSEVVHTIMMIQEDELKMKEKCEETRRDYTRKSRAFEDWSQKYMEKRAARAASSTEAAAGGDQDPVGDRKAAVDALKLKLADEEEAYRKTCKQVREKSVGSLKTHLPELFRAMSEFSMACSEMYSKILSVTTQPQETLERHLA
ncbi:uncharacterized protein M6B38_247645 [Iris pallida]|uniref:DUF632 domain-containing protein n=1 Tax=Iris pallida TaxID=29817 RepID=A0AAX6DG09_IRIPA|nr:uncharacterized protein M6B38_247645 [Iris pallida]